MATSTDQTHLHAELKAVEQVLAAAGDTYWLPQVRHALFEPDNAKRTEMVRRWFHKDGIGDLWLCEMNGHDVQEEDFESVNADYSKLTHALFQAVEAR